MTLYEFVKKLINNETNIYCLGSFNNKDFFLSDKMLYNSVKSNKSSWGRENDIINNVILELVNKNFFSNNDNSNFLDEYLNIKVEVSTFKNHKNNEDLISKFFELYNQATEITILYNGDIDRIIKVSQIAEINNNDDKYLSFIVKDIERYSIIKKNIVNVYKNGLTLFISVVDFDELER